MPAILTETQKNSPLYKYYQLPINPVPAEQFASIMQMTGETPCAITCQELNRMFESESAPDDYGIYRCPDGGLMLSNVMPVPNITPEMFDWWYAWHGLDSMRYIIWDKDDHYYCQTRDVEHTLDSSLSMRERYWNTTHDVQEALLDGDDPIPVMIPFVPPTVIGFDPEKLAAFEGTIVCTSGPVIMFHFLQPAKEGYTLRSRFYLGYETSPEGNRRLPDYHAPVELARAMLVHNIKEYTHLGKILPDLYREFRDSF